MVQGQDGELLAPGAEEGVSPDDERLHATLHQRCKCRVDFLRIGGAYHLKFEPAS